MKEAWKDIIGFEGLYQVSSLGRIRSLDRFVYNSRAISGKRPIKSQIIKQSIQRNGYANVHLSKEGKGINVLVHRAVAKAFIPNPNNLPAVDHIDTDKTNNNGSNKHFNQSTKQRFNQH